MAKGLTSSKVLSLEGAFVPRLLLVPNHEAVRVDGDPLSVQEELEVVGRDDLQYLVKDQGVGRFCDCGVGLFV